ncbi:hypothetical protein GGH96_002279 [Coemansia sp. RSA 1972]|nr:hypothetical protein GGH96_002279 [Coemansia sp. RSA 1972]
MSNWYVSHVHPPEAPKPQFPFWCAPHDAHHHHKCGCHVEPKKEASIPADVLSGMLNQVKGIPGTHEFTFSRTVEPEKTPWQVYQDKLAEYYKKYPHMHPHAHPHMHPHAHPHMHPHYHAPPPAPPQVPAHHFCGGHHCSH